ncbi:MAG: transcriptional initiation protein Tat [Phycisphaerales bacterium]|nr:transcriptional initiation protein Tat [Phycisphaerales bacterium]
MARREFLGQFARGGLVIGAALAAGGIDSVAASAADATAKLEPRGAETLQDLTQKLAAAARVRSFKHVPMILTDAGQWDDEALKLVISYQGHGKQVWDNTDIASPWLNLMRNSLNAQVWSFKQPNFLCASATHGTAHLALYDAYIWEKYSIPKVLKGKYRTNIFLDIPKAVAGKNPADFNDPTGLFSPDANCIPLLMQRGVVFLACHNAIWEFSGKLIKGGRNPDHLSHEALAAELTNHLIAGAILTPGIVATLPMLEAAGFAYAK